MGRRKVIKTVLPTAAIIILIMIEFLVHRSVPFMMDDLWYSTNLVTGEDLHGLSDVVQSQVWHFLNWGGRCMTHGLLQLILMCPEWAADLLNIGTTLLLSLLICIASGQKQVLWFLMAFSMMVSLNANWKMSMFWQSGAVNYVYSSVWILMFLWTYIRQMENPEGKSLPFVNFWIIPLGILAGWSNENMGPTCFILALTATLYTAGKKRRVAFWMPAGAAASLAGSIFVIAAPGNFVRNAFLPKKGILETVGDRLLSMLTAGADFLFPSVVLLILLLFVYTVCAGGRLRAAQWTLLAGAILSFGAMVLSPHYPDRATFGTMILCIVLSLSIWRDLLKGNQDLKPYAAGMAAGCWIFAVYTLLNDYMQRM